MGARVQRKRQPPWSCGNATMRAGILRETASARRPSGEAASARRVGGEFAGPDPLDEGTGWRCQQVARLREATAASPPRRRAGMRPKGRAWALARCNIHVWKSSLTKPGPASTTHLTRSRLMWSRTPA